MSSPHPARNVHHRPWALAVNGVAASPLVGMRTRLRLLRRAGIDVGEARIFPRCYFHTADAHIGAGVLLNHGVHVENVARVSIGARTAVGTGATILTSTHEIGPPEERGGAWTWHPVTIGAGCWIGARALVLPGVTVGEGCVVAAGAVVHADCEPHGLYAGVPARRLRDLPAAA